MEYDKRLRNIFIVLGFIALALLGLNFIGLSTYGPEEKITGNITLHMNRFVSNSSSITVELEGKSFSLPLSSFTTQELSTVEEFGENISGYQLENITILLDKFELSAPKESGVYGLSIKVYDTTLIYESFEDIIVDDGNINVHIDNHPPVFTDIPQQTWSKNTVHTLDLQNYVSDPDNDPLVISYTELTHITLDINNFTLTFTPEKDFIGEEEIWFGANDSTVTVYSYKAVLNVTDSNFSFPIKNEAVDALVDLSSYGFENTACADNNSIIFDPHYVSIFEVEVNGIIRNVTLKGLYIEKIKTSMGFPQCTKLIRKTAEYNMTCIIQYCSKMITWNIINGSQKVVWEKGEIW